MPLLTENLLPAAEVAELEPELILALEPGSCRIQVVLALLRGRRRERADSAVAPPNTQAAAHQSGTQLLDQVYASGAHRGAAGARWWKATISSARRWRLPAAIESS